MNKDAGGTARGRPAYVRTILHMLSGCSAGARKIYAGAHYPIYTHICPQKHCYNFSKWYDGHSRRRSAAIYVYA
jgi:hypothetical protein